VKFVKVARSSDLRNRCGKLVHVDGVEIALWRIDGTVYAINNICPHQHFSVLHQATLDGLSVTCPMHGWTFSLEDGHPGIGNGRARVYQVNVVGEDVYMEKPESTW
jgi:nitrite reductase/ring-hydroxylating ferredoxin subunit